MHSLSLSHSNIFILRSCWAFFPLVTTEAKVNLQGVGVRVLQGVCVFLNASGHNNIIIENHLYEVMPLSKLLSSGKMFNTRYMCNAYGEHRG